MNIDDRLRAAGRALKEGSVAQVDAASRLREIARRTDQPVAHGPTAALLDEPQESPRSLASSLPASRKVSASAAESSAAATPTSHWTDGETRSTFHSRPPSGNGIGRLLGSIWRYRWLITAAMLLGALALGGRPASRPSTKAPPEWSWQPPAPPHCQVRLPNRQLILTSTLASRPS